MIKYTNDSFVKKCKEIHNDRYDYSLVEYSGFKNKIKIICPEHGLFEQRAQAHILGNNCKFCYNDSRNITKEQFIRLSKDIHSDRYLYDEYISLKKKINIVCKKHGKFLQMPYRHLRGQGCASCARENHRILESDFISRSKEIHSNKYDYSLVKYINHSTKVEIICKEHGTFKQTPNNHMIHKKGCHKCSRIISKMESEWLDALKIEKSQRQYTLKIENKRFVVDGIDLKNKIIYEFYGDYWHGNINLYKREDINKVTKKSFGELYENTIRREDFLRKSGYKVISIWEEDFKKSYYK